MAQIIRMRNELEWPVGGPGVNTYYFSGGVPSPLDWVNIADQAATELGAVFDVLASAISSQVAFRVSADVDVIDVESGNLVDQFSLSPAPEDGVGLDGSSKATRAQQGYFRFRTDRYEDGTRLAGGTFIGPVGTSRISADGTWPDATRTEFEDAWAALTSGVGPRLAVYHRPAQGASTGGYYGDVTSVRMKRTPGSLRSRRD